MKLPSYSIVGECPVKILPTESGGMQVLAFDWATRDFVPDDGYFLKKVMTGHGDIEYLEEDEFDAYVATLRQPK